MSFLYSPPGTITGPFTGAAYVLNGTVTAAGSNEFFLPGANNPSIAVAGVVVFGLTSTLALVTNTGGIEHQQTGAAAGGQVLLAGGPSGVTTNRIRYTSNAAGNNLFAIRDDTNAVDRLTIGPTGGITITAPTAQIAAVDFASATGSAFVLMPLRFCIGHSGGDFPIIGYNLVPTVTAGVYNYNASTVSSAIQFQSGGINFLQAGAGVAGNPITFTTPLAISAAGNTTVAGSLTLAGGQLLATSAALTNNAGAQIATITNGPTAGNPTKWFPINDNGTIRNIPSW